ncbi:MAG: DUF4249 family protein [Candidatus Cryptobacteroides sp.]
MIRGFRKTALLCLCLAAVSCTFTKPFPDLGEGNILYVEGYIEAGDTASFTVKKMYPILPDSHTFNYEETPFDADIRVSRNGEPEEIQRKLKEDGGFYGKFITGEPFNDGDVLELEVSVDGFPDARCTTVVPVRPSVELLSYSFEGTNRFDCNMKISRSDATRYFGFRIECKLVYDEYINDEYSGKYVKHIWESLSVPGFLHESRKFVMPYGVFWVADMGKDFMNKELHFSATGDFSAGEIRQYRDESGRKHVFEYAFSEFRITVASFSDEAWYTASHYESRLGGDYIDNMGFSSMNNYTDIQGGCGSVCTSSKTNTDWIKYNEK